MQDQYNVKEVLHQALQALNSEGDKTAYFDLHDDSLITYGIPENFSADKEGMSTITKYGEPFLMQNMNLNMLLSMETKQHVCFPLPVFRKMTYWASHPVTNSLELTA